MALTITSSSYAGEHAGQYLGAALKSASSLTDITVLENVKFKRPLNKVAGSGLITAANCGDTPAGTLTLTERVIEPKQLQIFTDLCKKTMAQDWMAAQMGAGQNGQNAPADFTAFVMQYLGETIADHIEGNVWNGADSGAGFQGFATDTTGTLAVDGDVVDVVEAALTSGNILTQMGAVRDAIPTAVYGKSDLNIYMSTKAIRLYIAKMASLGYMNQYHVGAAPLNFEGINVVHAAGLGDDNIVAAQKSNLFFGTDLFSDTTSLKVIDLEEVNGSPNIRVVANFTAGVQHGVGADIVLHGTSA